MSLPAASVREPRNQDTEGNGLNLKQAESKTAGNHTDNYDVEAIRRDFPILQSEVHGKPLVYLDNAASSQKPLAVIETIDRYYREENANIHRGLHALSERATIKYEKARKKLAAFLNAGDSREIIFVRGGTEAINLVAATFGRQHVGEGDEVLITHMEHHSNIVPWQMLCEEKGAHLRVVPMDETGTLKMDEFETLLTERTRILAVTHVSNALGTINPVKKIIQMAKAKGIPVLVDGAQAVPHHQVDVVDLDCDFYAFSGHKMFGPTGIGVLYGKREHLEAMPPYQGGGEMISEVHFDRTVYNVVPHKFEAGTPNIAGAIGLGAAVDYLESVGLDRIEAYEHELLKYGTEALQSIDGLRLYGTAAEKAGVLSFMIDDIHPHDIGTIVDREGVAVRAGHHCAQPVMEFFGVPSTARASLALYNTRSDIDQLVRAIHSVKELFA